MTTVRRQLSHSDTGQDLVAAGCETSTNYNFQVRAEVLIGSIVSLVIVEGIHSKLIETSRY